MTLKIKKKGIEYREKKGETKKIKNNKGKEGRTYGWRS